MCLSINKINLRGIEFIFRKIILVKNMFKVVMVGSTIYMKIHIFFDVFIV